MIERLRLCCLVALVGLATLAGAQEPVVVMPADDPAAGWEFGNGPEFPGAKGEIATDRVVMRGGKPTLRLLADFSGGGGYVQAGYRVKDVDLAEFTVWMRNPGLDHMTMRFIDGGGQCHQINVKLDRDQEWQLVSLPLERFFRRRGESDAPQNLSRYEYWSGAKDGRWHGPCTGIYLLVGPQTDRKPYTVYLQEATIISRPAEVAGAETKARIELLDIAEGQHDWQTSLGEVAGSKGGLTVLADTPAAGQSSLRFSADFTGGGAYVAAIRRLAGLDIKDVSAFHIRYRTPNVKQVSVQLVDGTGQTHQRKDFNLTPDGQWHDWELLPTKVAGGEHWGGANDGQWHGPPTQFVINLTAGTSDPEGKKPVLELASVSADALLPVFRQPAAFRADFEGVAALPADWKTVGGVTLETATPLAGKGSLRLARVENEANRPCSATSPSFPVMPGQWEIGFTQRPELVSPDNSYQAELALAVADAGGKALDRLILAETFGRAEAAKVAKRVELPKGAASARLEVTLRKAWGSIVLDDITAAYLAPAARRDDRIQRVMMASGVLGNLLLPTDPRRMTITLEANRPLREEQKTATWSLRDYWGADQAQPATVSLGQPKRRDNLFVYETSVDLAALPIEVGRYYELHLSVPQPGDEPYQAMSTLAVLPEAETRAFRPEQVPFTARNWDNRIGEYIRLTDRLGVRICGIWGVWDSKPPYKPSAPQLDLVTSLGMGVLTGTPCATIERGEKTYDLTALREGAKAWVQTYGKTRPLVINLGNEPHGKGDVVLANVAAYQAVYEAIKAADPTIPVVATSVEPNEEYFKAGYGKWCDAYDFHIYESAADVRRTIREYRELMRRYNVVKPIWSTELGLNSQGMSRLTVATELWRKFVSFFAEGGQSVSWFGLLYPDAEGKLHGTSGEAHNVFFCRYNRYCPKLDAVAYYDAVNAIGIKKFVAEKTYDGGLHAFLFSDADRHRLQVLWRDKGRGEVLVPLPGVDEVTVIRIDGSRRKLAAGRSGLTLSVSEEPLVLRYDGGDGKLPEVLDKPLATITALPASVRRGQPVELTVSGPATDVVVPPLWRKASAGGKFTLTPPAGSEQHTADLVVTLAGGRGELYARVPISER